MCRFFAVHEKKEKKEPKKRKKSKLLVNYNLRDARPQANSKQQASCISPIGPTVNAIKCNGSTPKHQKPNNPKNAPFLHFYVPTLSNYTYFTLSFKNTPVLRLIIENKT